jgi:hypothetical protein
MTIANMALAGNQGMHSSSRPQFTYRVNFDLTASYVAGGYADFAASVAEAIGAGKTIIDIRQSNECGGYWLIYDRVNDKLMVYRFPTSAGPATEFPAGALAVTDCEMTVEAT